MRQVRRIATAIGTAALPLSVATVGVGQQAPPAGCFCLAESDSVLAQVQKGCTRVRGEGEDHWRAICSYFDATGALQIAPAIDLTEDWRILLPGESSCEICDPQFHDGPTVPRGDESDQATE